MNVKKIVLLFGALVIAVVTAVMAKNMFVGAGADQAAAAPAVPLGPKVLVARKALPVGTIIDAESLAYQPWPKELIQSAYYTEGAPDSDMAKLLGTVVRYPVTAGQPLTHGALVGPNDRGFLAAALGPGMRAVTVPVSTSSGVAASCSRATGRHVLRHPGGAGRRRRPAAQGLRDDRRNVRVLATDQRIDSRARTARPRSRPFNVTLEVTPRIAEKVAVAQSMGSLTCRCARSPTIPPRSSGRFFSHQVKSSCRWGPTRPRSGACCWRRQSSDGQQHDLYHGWRCVALPAPQCPGRATRPLVLASASRGGPASAGPSAAPVYTGPVVRVARGNNITVVPVGAR